MNYSTGSKESGKLLNTDKFMAINFITTQSLLACSGGWSGTSFNLYTHLEKNSLPQPSYIGPVNPPISNIAKFVSKTRRILGGQGNFYFFSSQRLSDIQKLVAASLKKADYNLFLGVTPWIKCSFSLYWNELSAGVETGAYEVNPLQPDAP